MNTKAVYSRTLASWRLAFAHAGQTLHFLTRALLLTLASVGLIFAWLCCWVDRFRSDKGTAWLIPVKAQAEQSRGRLRSVELEEKLQPRPVERMHHHKPRTIDSMIRSKGMQL